jgi:hypothetical protein
MTTSEIISLTVPKPTNDLGYINLINDDFKNDKLKESGFDNFLNIQNPNLFNNRVVTGALKWLTSQINNSNSPFHSLSEENKTHILKLAKERLDYEKTLPEIVGTSAHGFNDSTIKRYNSSFSKSKSGIEI